MIRVLTRIGLWLATLLVVLILLITAMLFTSWGNQGISAIANKWVDGLNIDLPEGRFLYNDPFTVHYQNGDTNVRVTQLQIDSKILACWGICFDNISAQTVDLNLPMAPADATAQEPATVQEQESEAGIITIPLVNLKRVAVDSLNVALGTTKINAQKLNVALSAEQQQINLKELTLAYLGVSMEPAPAEPQAPFTELPAVENIVLNLGLEAEINKFKVDEFEFKQGTQRQQLTDIRLSGAYVNNTAKVKALSLAYLLPSDLGENEYAHLALHGQAQFFDNNDLNLDIKASALEEQTSLKLTGALNALNAQLENSGKYPLSLDASADLTTRNWPFAVSLQQQDWTISSQGSRVALNRTDLNAKGNIDDYSLQGELNAQVDQYPEVNASINAAGSLSAVDLEKLFVKANESELVSTAKITLRPQLAVQFDTQLDNIRSEYFVPNTRSDLSGQLMGEFAMESEGNSWQISVQDSSIEGSINDQSLSLRADLTLDSDFKSDIKQLSLKKGLSSIDVSGQVDDNWNISGTINLDDTQPLYQDWFAKGQGRFSVRGELKNPNAEIDTKIASVQSNTIDLQQLALDGQFSGNLDAFKYQLELELERAEVGEQQILATRVQSQGDEAQQRVTVSTDYQAHTLALSAQNTLSKDILDIVLDELSIEGNEHDLALQEPTQIKVNLAKQTVQTSDLCLAGRALDLCLTPAQLSAEQGNVLAKLERFDLSALTPVLPQNISLQGSTSGVASLAWQKGKLHALDAELDSQGVQARVLRQGVMQRIDVETLTVKAQGNTKQMQSELVLGSSTLGNINAALGVSDLNGQQALSGNVKLTQMSLQKLRNFVDDLRTLNGDVNADFEIAGTLKEPRVNGQLAANNIAVEGDNLPLALTNSSINVSLNDEQASIEGNLITPDGGSLSLTGNGSIDPDALGFTVKVQGERFTVIPQQGVTIALSPNMDIKFADNALDIRGKVEVPYGRIKIKELPKGAVKVSKNVVLVNQEQEQVSAPFAYDAEISVVIKDDVYIDSFGLKSYLVGDLDVNADNETPPMATGELRLVDGRYRAFGQDLQIRTGQIGFSGSLNQPYINIEAIRDPDNTANGVVAGIKLIGSVEQPKLEVFSEPAMDSSQALSYVLNGQPLGEGDSSSDALLTQLLLAQGTSRSEGVVSKIGESFGLSDVTLGSSGSGDDTKVEIAGYIAPGLQLKYSVGVFESISEVAVRYQVLQQLYVEITSGLYDSFDVLYRFDVD